MLAGSGVTAGTLGRCRRRAEVQQARLQELRRSWETAVAKKNPR
jgi:hypothetical protein